MRAVLLRFVMEPFWATEMRDGIPFLGFGFVLIFWTLLAAASIGIGWLKRDPETGAKDAMFSLGTFVAVPLAAWFFVPDKLRVEGIPVFGYGFMLFIGISSAVLMAVYNAKRMGLNGDVIWDMAVWLVVPGITGGRMFYVLQKQYEHGFLNGSDLKQVLFRIVNLPDGGLVFYGAILGGLLGFLAYCYKRSLNVLQMGDIVVPSIFIGLGFGRIGCFLYGCCYGGMCSQPWAVQFPKPSVPFDAQMDLGWLAQNATQSLPIHPTQIYSSVNAFLLATVLILYLRHRPYNGAALAIGWLVYPIARFVIEILRNDEAALFGTGFTVSQQISIMLFVTGIIYTAVMVATKGRFFRPAAVPQPT